MEFSLGSSWVPLNLNINCTAVVKMKKKNHEISCIQMYPHGQTGWEQLTRDLAPNAKVLRCPATTMHQWDASVGGSTSLGVAFPWGLTLVLTWLMARGQGGGKTKGLIARETPVCSSTTSRLFVRSPPTFVSSFHIGPNVHIVFGPNGIWRLSGGVGLGGLWHPAHLHMCTLYIAHIMTFEDLQWGVGGSVTSSQPAICVHCIWPKNGLWHPSVGGGGCLWHNFCLNHKMATLR